MIWNIFWEVLQESFFLVLATVLGTLFLKRLNYFFKIHVIQLWIALAFDFLAKWAVINEGVLGIGGQNNSWLYNLYISLEAFLLLWASFIYFQSSSKRNYLVIILALSITTAIVEITLFGFFELINYTFVVTAISIVVISLLILYKSINSYYPSKQLLPEFWISLGIILYYALNAPYFAFFDFKGENWEEVRSQLFSLTIILSKVRYFLTALSLYMCFKIGKSQFNKSYGA